MQEWDAAMYSNPAPKARVFISCGQRNADEMDAAQRVESVLKGLGFDPLLVAQQTSFSGVLENVFQQIQAAEYYLFIDFWREDGPSVFSHQELAIAAYLDREWLLLQDSRWQSKRPGLMGFVPAHVESFAAEREVPALVQRLVGDKVSKHEWDTNWRRELRATLGSPPYSDAWAPLGAGLSVQTNLFQGTVGNWLTRFFQVQIENLDHIRVAHGCVGYLEGLRDLTAGVDRKLSLACLKWGGATSATVEIPPKGVWPLDIIRAPLATGSAVVAFNPFITDWGGIQQQYTIEPNHDYELGVVVYSDNFPPAKIRIHIHFGKDSTNLTASPAGMGQQGLAAASSTGPGTTTITTPP